MSGGGAVVFCCIQKKKKLFSSCKQNADGGKCFRDLEFSDDAATYQILWILFCLDTSKWYTNTGTGW